MSIPPVPPRQSARHSAASAPRSTVNNGIDEHRTPVVLVNNKSHVIASSKMWLLLLALAGLWAAAAAAHNGSYGSPNIIFPKCCADGESLMKITDMYISEQYSCVDREVAETNYSVVVSPLVIGDSIFVEYGMPDVKTGCGELEMTEVDHEFETDGKNCYDRLIIEIINDTLKQSVPKVISLTCAEQQEDEKIAHGMDWRYIRKCCPPDQSYDIEYHMCRGTNVTGPNSERWLTERLDPHGRFVYEMDYQLECKADEYALEISESMFELEVEDGTLTVSRAGEVLGNIKRGEWCLDRGYQDGMLVARACSRDCVAFGAFCLRKCCPVGYHYVPRRCGSTVSVCRPNTDDFTPLDLSYYLGQLKQSHPDFSPDVLGLRTSLSCKSGKFLMHNNDPDDAHHLEPSGVMWTLPILGGPTHEYCLETFDSRKCDKGVTVETLRCLFELEKTKNFAISVVTISISCVFLFLTLVVYCCLSELRNLHGKIVISHVTTMLFGFCCLLRVQLPAVIEDKTVCKMLGYGVYFGFVAGFAWLNVMCLDIWWTFGSVRTIHPLRKAQTERRRFAWYSLYAWGVAVLMTSTTLLLDMYPVSKYLDSDIGKDICWFGQVQNTVKDWPHYIFFVMPMGLIVCVNFVLWVLTARHCHRVKSEMHRLQAGSAGDKAKRRFSADHARYTLTIKLWVVMGAGWVWEILSTVVENPPWLWNTIDILNELQGVSIFIILVMKPKLYYLIRKKLGLEKTGDQKNGTSARTSSTFLSRTISSEERALQRVSLPNAKSK